MEHNLTPVRKIISGGQTGVDRAALDVAIALSIPCGGWCPRGRLAEDGVIPEKYPLKETESADYAERTAMNVRDSDGTLVITWAPPADGTAYTVDVALALSKPHYVVDLREGDDVDDTVEWLWANRIRTLNVAGPRAGKCPRIYPLAVEFLTRLLRGNP